MSASMRVVWRACFHLRRVFWANRMRLALPVQLVLLALTLGCCYHNKPRWSAPALAQVRKDALHDRLSCMKGPDAMLADIRNCLNVFGSNDIDDDRQHASP